MVVVQRQKVTPQGVEISRLRHQRCAGRGGHGGRAGCGRPAGAPDHRDGNGEWKTCITLSLVFTKRSSSDEIVSHRWSPCFIITIRVSCQGIWGHVLNTEGLVVQAELHALDRLLRGNNGNNVEGERQLVQIQRAAWKQLTNHLAN